MLNVKMSRCHAAGVWGLKGGATRIHAHKVHCARLRAMHSGRPSILDWNDTALHVHIPAAVQSDIVSEGLIIHLNRQLLPCCLTSTTAKQCTSLLRSRRSCNTSCTSALLPCMSRACAGHITPTITPCLPLLHTNTLADHLHHSQTQIPQTYSAVPPSLCSPTKPNSMPCVPNALTGACW